MLTFSNHTRTIRKHSARQGIFSIDFYFYRSHFAESVIAKYFHLPVFFYVRVQQRPVSNRISQKANARRDAALIHCSSLSLSLSIDPTHTHTSYKNLHEAQRLNKQYDLARRLHIWTHNFMHEYNTYRAITCNAANGQTSRCQPLTHARPWSESSYAKKKIKTNQQTMLCERVLCTFKFSTHIWTGRKRSAQQSILSIP